MSALVPARSKTRMCSVCDPGPGTVVVPLVAWVRGAAVPGSAAHGAANPASPCPPSRRCQLTGGGGPSLPYQKSQCAPPGKASGSRNGTGVLFSHRLPTSQRHGAGPGPAVRVDRGPRRQQVADLEMDVRPGRIPGAAAEGDQLSSGHMLPRIDEELIVMEVGGAIVRVVDHDAEAAAVTPLAIDDGPVIGRHHRRIGGDGVVGAPMAVVGVAGGAVEADHDPVLLASRVMVIRPGGDAWGRDPEG